MLARTSTQARARRRPVLLGLLAGLLLLGAVLAVRVATEPSGSRLDRFSPEDMATLEQQAWQAYYERRWPTLFLTLFRVTREQFGLSAWQSLHATVVATRAQVVFGREGDAGGKAEADMRRFYELVREAGGGRYDPARAASAEVDWWVVHRHRADYPDTTALVEALAELYAVVYQIPVEAGRPAAKHRARAMEVSDRWVRDGRDSNSPLLAEIRAELLESYRALKVAITE